MVQTKLRQLGRSVMGLMDAAARLKADAPNRDTLQTIVDRGEFRPAENEAIAFWFARFLTIRGNLWSVIDDTLDVLEGNADSQSDPSETDLQYFLVGYAAACLLVGIDRLMLFDVAHHSIIQRKLNEPFKELRIPRKQFTNILEAFVDEKDALALLDAMKFAKRHRRRLLAMRSDPHLGPIAVQLRELETALDPSIREYLRGAWTYISHKWRRRGVVSANNILAGVSESVGRVASEFYQSSNKKVTADIRNSIGEFLQPGDVLITRHSVALTNLFMPGFWPHAALYVGTPAQRDTLGVQLPDDKQELWSGDICTLEALKDGVRLRPLSDTLAVDHFAVLRPQVPADTVRSAIERGVLHEGKMYNFDFDFFSSDRLVCTEVIYRAYDGLDGIEFPLTERAGRKTLSAEDLLDFAIDSDAFQPVAVFGVPGCDSDIEFGNALNEYLIASYRTG